jgi:CRISPR-associated protein Cas1
MVPFSLRQINNNRGEALKKSYYVFNNGSIKRKDNTLQFVDETGNKRDIPVEQVEDLYILGEVTINTKLLNFLSQNGIPLHFFKRIGIYMFRV